MKTEDEAVDKSPLEVDLDQELTEKELALYGRLFVIMMRMPHYKQFYEANFDARIVINDEDQTVDWQVSQVDMEVAARRLAGMLKDQPQPIVYEPTAEEIALLAEKGVG